MGTRPEDLFGAACEMAMTAVYLYADWEEKAEPLPEYWDPVWNSFVSWALEYYDGGEVDWGYDEEVGVGFFEKITAEAEKIQKAHPDTTQHTDYALFCLWIINVLDQFSQLMYSDVFEETPYPGYFSAFSRDYETLRASVIHAAQLSRQGIGAEAWQELERVSRLLTDQWLRLVYQRASS